MQYLNFLLIVLILLSVCVVKYSRTRIVLENCLLSRAQDKYRPPFCSRAQEPAVGVPCKCIKGFAQVYYYSKGLILYKKNFAILNFTTIHFGQLRIKLIDAAILVISLASNRLLALTFQKIL